jgi:hypothetical protein
MTPNQVAQHTHATLRRASFSRPPIGVLHCENQYKAHHEVVATRRTHAPVAVHFTFTDPSRFSPIISHRETGPLF